MQLCFNYNCVIPDIVCKAEEPNFLTCGFTPPSKLFWTLCPPYKPGSLKLNRSPGSDVSAVELNTEWKKDELQVSFIMLRDCWRHYETTVRDAKRKCLSDINLSNCHKPCVRFKTIDSILIVLQTVHIEVCMFIIDMVSSSRDLISPFAYDPSISVTCSAVPNQPVTLPCLEKSVNQIFPV